MCNIHLLHTHNNLLYYNQLLRGATSNNTFNRIQEYNYTLYLPTTKYISDISSAEYYRHDNSRKIPSTNSGDGAPVVVDSYCDIPTSVENGDN